MKPTSGKKIQTKIIPTKALQPKKELGMKPKSEKKKQTKSFYRKNSTQKSNWI